MRLRLLGLEVPQQTPQLGLPCAIEQRPPRVRHILGPRNDPLRFLLAPAQEIAHDRERPVRALHRLPTPDDLLPHLEPLKCVKGRADDADGEMAVRELARHLPCAREGDRVDVAEALSEGRVGGGYLVDERLELEGGALDGARAC